MIKNYYYAYGILWGSVLALYFLGWSNLNVPIPVELAAFFLITIPYCLLMGYANRRSFDEVGICAPIAGSNPRVLLAIFALFGMTFAYLGYVPLISILGGATDYGSLRTSHVPLLPVMCATTGITHFAMLADSYAQSRERKSLMGMALILSLFLLYFNRGALLICLYIVLILSSSTTSPRMVRRKHGPFAIVVVVLLALWLFGCLGNLRHGYEWNDNTYIMWLGLYNDKVPPFLPRQYLWSYSYITSPLSSLCFNMHNANYDIDVLNLIYACMPSAIAKRLPLYVQSFAERQVSYFTVSSIWSDLYVFGGGLGLFIGFIVQFVELRVAHSAVRGTRYQRIGQAMMSMVIAFSFFTNTFSYPEMAYPLWVIVILALRDRHSSVSSEFLVAASHG